MSSLLQEPLVQARLEALQTRHTVVDIVLLPAYVSVYTEDDVARIKRDGTVEWESMS